MSLPRLIAISCLFGLLVSALPGCGQPDQQPVRIGTNTWPGYEPLYLARARSDLPRDTFRLVEYSSTTQVLRALRNKSLEAAAVTLDEALLLVADHVPIKIILVMDVSNGGDVIMARPGIQSMQDLRGKRVGVESGALGAYMLTRALQVSGMDVGDVDVRRLDANAHEQAYLSGEVDAVVTFDPVRTRLHNAGAVEIFSTRQLPGEIVDVLVVHDDLLAARTEVFRTLVDSWFRSLVFLHEQPDEASRIIARRLKITPAEAIANYQGMTLPDRQANLRLLGGDAPALQGTVRQLSQILLDNDLLPRPVSGDELLSSAALH